MTTIRERIKTALAEAHDDEDFDAAADAVIAALGGVKRERQFGRVLGADERIIMLDFAGPFQHPQSGHHERERIGWATPWEANDCDAYGSCRLVRGHDGDHLIAAQVDGSAQ